MVLRSKAAVVLALAFVAPAHAADIPAQSRIDAVMVFPSGAEVTRQAKVRVSAGDHTIVIDDLPAEVNQRSIRVEGTASGRLEIGAVDTRRVSVMQSDTAATGSERKALEDRIERLKDERQVLEGEAQSAEVQKNLLSNLAQLPLKAAGSPGGQTAQPDWAQLYSLIGGRYGEAHRNAMATLVKIRAIDRDIKDLEKKLALLAPKREARTEARIRVTAATGTEAELSIRYQVRNASWQPYYDARLDSGGRSQPPKLTLIRRAGISQRTGEDWTGVALSLSTTRPTSSTAAPGLDTQLVDFEPDTPPPPPVRPAPMAMQSRRMAAPAREERIGGGLGAADAVGKIAVNEASANIESAPFQAIYKIAGRTSIPATGESKRVQIGRSESEPTLEVRAVPMLDTNAYLYAKAKLASGTPLLPGAVSLFRDATFVGVGRLPLVPVGEAHELGFGIDDAVRIKHAVIEEKRGEFGLISSSKTDVRNFRITIKNLHERPISATVIDRIPVSVNQDIKVELTAKTMPTKRDVQDKRGVLSWQTTLTPDEERIIDFGYRVTWPGAKKVTYR